MSILCQSSSLLGKRLTVSGSQFAHMEFSVRLVEEKNHFMYQFCVNMRFSLDTVPWQPWRAGVPESADILTAYLSGDKFSTSMS